MTAFRRILSSLSALILVSLGFVYTGIVVQFDRPWPPILWGMVASFTIPALAHVFGAALSWPRESRALPQSTMKYGLFASGLASLAWALLCFMAATRSASVSTALGTVVGSGLLAVSALANLIYFWRSSSGAVRQVGDA
jgi:drug/metabolite transporter (DMT)-like permease